MKPTPGFVFAALAAATLALPPLHATGVQVGVLPSGGCPGGTAPYSIYIDNEDSNNANSRSGWISSILSTQNTHFYLCKVDGTQFKHVPNNPYMVVSLGSQCPNGAKTVFRTFDSDDSNNPGSWTDIDWVAEGLPIDVVWPWHTTFNDQRRDVSITFCLFDGNGIHTGPMPQFGWDYGVFAAPGVSFATASGFVHTDDEDHAVWNRWCEDSSVYLNRTSWSCTTSAQTYRNYGNGAMEGGTNTDLRIVRVKGTIYPDGACRGTENCADHPLDCGACQVCGNGICEINEYCPQDCGYCGDHLCQGSETCTSCCGDCGPCPGDPWGICYQQE
jgi:hypothetical protein